MDHLLFAVAVALLVLSFGIRMYGMVQLADKKLTEEERLSRYKKVLPYHYVMLLPAALIIIYLILTRA